MTTLAYLMVKDFYPPLPVYADLLLHLLLDPEILYSFRRSVTVYNRGLQEKLNGGKRVKSKVLNSVEFRFFLKS